MYVCILISATFYSPSARQSYIALLNYLSDCEYGLIADIINFNIKMFIAQQRKLEISK